MAARASGDLVATEGAAAEVLVVILGYSGRPGGTLHPICRARLERARQEAGPGRAVLFSGGARRGHREPEAELMRRAWREAGGLLDTEAKTTSHALVRAATLAGELGVGEVRLVTSRWHMRRSLFVLRRALPRSAPRVSAAPACDSPSVGSRCRELVSWALLPVELSRRLLARRLGLVSGRPLVRIVPDP